MLYFLRSRGCLLLNPKEILKDLGAWPRLGRSNNPSLISSPEGGEEIVSPPFPWWTY
jgi:hypothetical protein